MSDGSGFCDKPDRHSPGTRCGYPMPCPIHTFVFDEKSGVLLIPSEANETQVRMAREVTGALRTEFKSDYDRARRKP